MSRRYVYNLSFFSKDSCIMTHCEWEEFNLGCQHHPWQKRHCLYWKKSQRYRPFLSDLNVLDYEAWLLGYRPRFNMLWLMFLLSRGKYNFKQLQICKVSLRIGLEDWLLTCLRPKLILEKLLKLMNPWETLGCSRNGMTICRLNFTKWMLLRSNRPLNTM